MLWPASAAGQCASLLAQAVQTMALTFSQMFVDGYGKKASNPGRVLRKKAQTSR